VFSSSIAALINLGLNLLVVVVAMALNHVAPMETIIFLPLLLVELYLLALGAALFLSAAFVKFRDLGFIWEVITQLGFYLTPILYAMTLLPHRFQKLQLLNPVAQVIQDARYSLISHDLHIVTISRVFDGGWYRLIPFGIAMLVLLGGLAYFKSQANSFAENI
jgi:ABC-2 type transport system permease protein